MIFIFYLNYLVAMALPWYYLNVTLNLKKEILGISPIILLYVAILFKFCLYSVIGSGIGIYSGLFFNSDFYRLFNFYVNSFIFIWVCFHYLFYSIFVDYLLIFSHHFYLDSFITNPIYFMGLDLFNWVIYDLEIYYSALFLPLYSLKNSYRNYKFSNYLLTPYVNYSSKIDNKNNNLDKDLNKIIGGGYTSYKNVLPLGYLIELLDNKPLLIKKLSNYLSNLENDKTFTLLPIIRWINEDTGLSNSITVSDSMKISKFVDKELLADKISEHMRKSLYRYKVNQSNSELILMYRVWLDIKDFNVKENDFTTITKSMDNLLSKKNYNNQLLITERLNSIENDKYNKIIMDNYGDPIFIDDITTNYNLNSYQYLSVKKLSENTNFITVKNLDNSDQNIINWTDTKTDFGFIRNKDSLNYFFNKNGIIFKTESSYNFLDYPLDNIHDELDEKIGAIDFETFGDEGFGIQNVYAAGWAINDFNKTKKFYYFEKDGNSLDIVKNLINDLANNKDINGYTFYAHNLGRFDSVFLIKACLLLDDIEIKPTWKENKILSITFINTKMKCKFKILDSIQMLNGSLDSLCKSFNIINKKGIFPHNFVNKDNLFYIGDTPDFYYFKNMDINLYKFSSNWDLKAECLKYLQKDVLGLLEIMTKFNEKIFNLYTLNITKFVTAPKLAAAIFTSNFYTNSNDLKIKMIKGNVEKEIREAYFGGNVNTYVNKMDQGYYYDMNSQYPYAMLKDLPVGNPTFSNDNVLDNYFGFVYGEITAPDYNTLRVPFIQLRDEKTGESSCPRGSFTRMIFSEEIKEALKHGYTIKVKYGYKFERGKNLFKDYVDTFYEIKKSTKDPVERALSKLLLNSLYGKFGMKDIISKMKILSKKEANKITKNYNYTIFSELSDDKVLIKYSSKLPDSITSLLKNKNDQIKENPLATVSRKRGVPSAVHISAAISAYARMSINNFKNIPGNPCIYSDTDSVVLSKSLPDIYVGKNLGQMKLEHKIEEGIFIRKKLYAIKDNHGQIIIKSSGVKSSTLNYDKFKLLLSGNSVNCVSLSFEVNWKNLNINIVNRSINLQGLKYKIIDIKDHYDINFKQIVPYIPQNSNNKIPDKLDNSFFFAILPYLKKILTLVYTSIYKFIFLIIKIFYIPK